MQRPLHLRSEGLSGKNYPIEIGVGESEGRNTRANIIAALFPPSHFVSQNENRRDVTKEVNEYYQTCRELEMTGESKKEGRHEETVS